MLSGPALQFACIALIGPNPLQAGKALFGCRQNQPTFRAIRERMDGANAAVGVRTVLEALVEAGASVERLAALTPT